MLKTINKLRQNDCPVKSFCRSLFMVISSQPLNVLLFTGTQQTVT